MPTDSTAIRRWLGDILDNIILAETFAADFSYETFKDDLLRIYGVTRCLEIISEASRRLPDEFKARHPAVSWKEMASAGNVYRHDYEDVAASRVWNTLHSAIPILRAVVEDELKSLGPD